MNAQKTFPRVHQRCADDMQRITLYVTKADIDALRSEQTEKAEETGLILSLSAVASRALRHGIRARQEATA